MEPETAISTQCVHCGDETNAPLYDDDKPFCCQGCRTVYRLLRDNGLEGYYDLDEAPGMKMEGIQDLQYAFLDDPSAREPFLEFTDGTISKVSLFIPNIHCSSCIWLLEHLYRLTDGIMESVVDLGKRTARFTFDERVISLRQLVELLDRIGYAPSLEETLGQKNQVKKKGLDPLVKRLGVAGFCFGNIMLLSFPEYLGAGDVASNKVYLDFFAWLNLILALPVFFYSSKDHFHSAFKGLRQRFINIDVPVSLGILTLFVRSSYDVIMGVGPGYFDSMAGLVFFLLVGKWVQRKTYKAFDFERDNRAYLPLATSRIREGLEENIPIGELEGGDIIRVRNGGIVPVDAQLESDSGSVDNSFITGESEPITVSKGDKVYAGARAIGSSMELLVVKVPERSYLKRLWNSEQFQGKKEAKLQPLLDHVGQYFTLVVLVISLATAIWWWVNGGSPWIALSAVLIVACPCALALTVPFTFGNAMRLAGRGGFFLKAPEVVERCGRVTDVVLDKTGTLTMTGERRVTYEGIPLSEKEKGMVRTLSNQSDHPLSRALSKYLNNVQGASSVDRVEEVHGEGVQGYVDGVEVKLGKASFVGIKKEYVDKGEAVHVSLDGVPKGSFLARAPSREGTDRLLKSLGRDLDLHLLSGDVESEKEKWAGSFPDPEKVRFQVTPEEKAEYVRDLVRKGRKVLMVGDGLNDAGALKNSTVGFAVSDNIRHFIPSSDGIIKGEVFPFLDSYLKYSRWSTKVLVISFVLSFLYNLVGIGFAVSGYLTPVVAAILMPLSSVSIVAFVTFGTWLALYPSGFRRVTGGLKG